MISTLRYVILSSLLIGTIQAETNLDVENKGWREQLKEIKERFERIAEILENNKRFTGENSSGEPTPGKVCQETAEQIGENLNGAIQGIFGSNKESENSEKPLSEGEKDNSGNQPEGRPFVDSQENLLDQSEKNFDSESDQTSNTPQDPSIEDKEDDSVEKEQKTKGSLKDEKEDQSKFFGAGVVNAISHTTALVIAHPYVTIGGLVVCVGVLYSMYKIKKMNSCKELTDKEELDDLVQ